MCIRDRTYTERRQAKAFSFELQYGASARGIANNWGVPVELTESFIDGYYKRYAGVKKYHEEGLEEVSATLSEEGDIDPDKKLAVPRFYIPSLWRDSIGMPLTEYRVLGTLNYNGESAKPPPTKVKNYPIQGAASDIVAMMLVTLSNYLNQGNEQAWLLNTVHDSVVCEISLGDEDRIIKEIKEILETVPKVLEQMFDIVCPIKFPVDCSTGTTFTEVKNIA